MALVPSLIDQYGNPVDPVRIDALRREVMPPQAAGVRSVFSESPADGLTPYRLASMLQAAALGDSYQMMELAEDIEERDPHYAAVLSTRRLQLIQLPMKVEAASDSAEHQAHAAFIDDWLATGVLEEALFDMSDATGKGYSVTEIIWEMEPGRIVPAALERRPQRWFEISWQNGEHIMARADGGYVELDPRKFVVHRSPQKSGLITRSSIARLAAFAWMGKAFTQRDWAVFVQNYGMPIRVGKYGAAASEQDKSVLFRAIANLAGDAAVMVPETMQIEFVEAKGTHQGKTYEERCEWIDRQISKAVLGQTTTTDAVRGGHAVSQEHRLVQEDIERSDAKRLSLTLTRQLVQPIIAFNFGPQAVYPRIRIGRPDETPLPELIAAIGDLGGMGLTVKASQVRDRLGMDKPDSDDDTIGGKPPPPPPLDTAKLALPAHGPGPAATGGAAADVSRNSSTPPLLRTLITRHAEQSPELVAALSARLADDAQGALAGLTDQVRDVFESAHSMADLAERLSVLNLDPAGFANAMQRGLALAQLVGQASLLDELRPAP